MSHRDPNQLVFVPGRSPIPIARLFAMLVLVLLIAGGSAHPPSDMTIQYVSGELTATINHPVRDPAVHYVNRVTILINGVPADTVMYSFQPPNTPFTYRYQIQAASGDVIEVTADCNIGGSITRQLAAGDSMDPAASGLVLWPYHALLQVLGFILLLSAVVVVRFGKKIPGWYRWHKHLAYAGSVLIIAALALAFFMVETSGGPHIRVPHAALGVFTLLLLVATLLIGIGREKIRPPKPSLRTIHLIVGLATALFLLVTILSGLLTAGVI